VRHEEEVELAIDDLGLLDEARVHVGTLRRVVDEVLALGPARLLEESLADALVHDDERDVGRGLRRRLIVAAVLHSNNAVQLGQLLVDDLLAHRVAHTVTVDENVARHRSVVELTVRRERALEVVGQNGGGDDLLALDGLGAGLGVVLAHVGIVGGTETNGRLLALVAYVDTDEHGLLRDLAAEGHAPKVTTKLGVHLADNVQENAVIVLSDSPVGHELGDDRCVAIDFVLEEGVEVLVVSVVRHNHEEDEIGVFDGAVRGLDRRQNLLIVVVLDRRGEGFEQVLLVLRRLVQNGADVGVLDADVEALLQR